MLISVISQKPNIELLLLYKLHSFVTYSIHIIRWFNLHVDELQHLEENHGYTVIREVS
jgi:hypothetical protein